MYSLSFTKQKTTKRKSLQGVSYGAKKSARSAAPLKKSEPSSLKKIKRYTKKSLRSILLSPAFHATFKVFSWAIISSSLLYGSYFFISKTFANEVVVSQSEIVARVAKLTPLPPETPYDIVRVQDEEALRKQNPFYKDVNEGDYILIYKDMAVIYDLRANSIVAVKHVDTPSR